MVMECKCTVQHQESDALHSFTDAHYPHCNTNTNACVLVLLYSLPLTQLDLRTTSACCW
jgi:hypothetical protein